MGGPWQAVLGLDRQVCGAALALGGVVGRKGDVAGGGDINVHLILKVRHAGGSGVCSAGGLCQ